MLSSTFTSSNTQTGAAPRQWTDVTDIGSRRCHPAALCTEGRWASRAPQDAGSANSWEPLRQRLCLRAGWDRRRKARRQGRRGLLWRPSMLQDGRDKSQYNCC